MTLLAKLLALAASTGYSAMSLSVESNNPAMALYERLGFVVVGRVGGSRTMRADLIAIMTVLAQFGKGASYGG